MDKNEHRGFKVSWTEKDVDEARMIELTDGWMSRKGDPAVLLEVFKIRDGYELKGTYVTRNVTTEKKFRDAIGNPKGIEVETFDTVVRAKVLADIICEDKTSRCFCTCRGW